MTSAQFDVQTIEQTQRLERIASNPNPAARNPWRVTRAWRASVAWGRRLDREAAIDSARNVFAVLGVGTVLGDFATMRYWMVIPCAAVALGVWYADYLRHF